MNRVPIVGSIVHTTQPCPGTVFPVTVGVPMRVVSTSTQHGGMVRLQHLDTGRVHPGWIGVDMLEPDVTFGQVLARRIHADPRFTPRQRRLLLNMDPARLVAQTGGVPEDLVRDVVYGIIHGQVS